MTDRTLVLTDLNEGIWHDTTELVPERSSAFSWSIRKFTLQGGRSSGVDVVEIDNGAFQLSVLPTRGMGLWKGCFQGIPLEWNSPVRWPVNPAFVNLEEWNGLGWLGGFQELLCRCGLGFNGPPGMDRVLDDQGELVAEKPITLHGKIANIPAHYVSCSYHTQLQEALSVTGIVDEAMMFGGQLRLTSTLQTEIGSNEFTIHDQIENLSETEAELELLYHTNIGRPFLEGGSRFSAPVEEVSPRDPRATEGISNWETYNEPELGYAEQVYYLKLLSDQNGQSCVLLKNREETLGVSLRFLVAELPCFALWKNTQQEADGYVTGLEPATNYPNFKSFEREQGRVLSLAPQEKYECKLQIAVHNSPESIGEMEDRISRIQNEQPATIHEHPTLPFAPK